MQRAGLAQVHEKSENAQSRDSSDADTGQAQGVLDILQIGMGLLVNTVQQMFAVATDGIHVLHAHIGEHDKAPGIVIALLVQTKAQLHLTELALHLPGQRCEGRQLLGVFEKSAAQIIHGAVDGHGGGAIGFEVALFARQQIAAQAGFRIQHQLHELIDLGAGVLRLGERVQRFQ